MVMSHPPTAHPNSLKTFIVPQSFIVSMTNSSSILTTQVFDKFVELLFIYFDCYNFDLLNSIK